MDSPYLLIAPLIHGSFACGCTVALTTEDGEALALRGIVSSRALAASPGGAAGLPAHQESNLLPHGSP